MELASPHLFVYGSLRSGFNHPAYAYISKYFTFKAEALVKGKLYQLPNYPAAIPTDEELFIKGELYEMIEPAESSWAFAQLDEYEGVKPEDGSMPFYNRVLTKVYFNNQNLQAWVYWYNQSVEAGVYIESGDLLAYLQQK